MDLRLDRVSHAYGATQVLEGIDLDIPSGRIVCLVGPSGCGKSTLLRFLGGLERPAEGRILQLGDPPEGCLNPLTYIFQDFALLPWRSVRGNVSLVLEDHGIRGARADAVIGEVGEGMSGISPRFIGDEIAEAIMDSMHRGRDFLSPLTTFNHLEGNLENHGSIPQENFETYYRYLELVREEYKERAIEDVRHALAYDVDEIQRQGEKYMDHVMAYIDDDTVEDELTGREQEPDETFLRSVEEKLDVPSDRIGALYGPSHAEEVAEGRPTTVVAAAPDEAAQDAAFS